MNDHVAWGMIVAVASIFPDHRMDLHSNAFAARARDIVSNYLGPIVRIGLRFNFNGSG
jgi:hypothetical protein